MTLTYLIQKEFLQIRRNSFLPKLIFAFPVMIMCVMPWVMNMEVKNIRVNVVDLDRSSRSRQIVHSIEASRYFVFCGQKPTYKDALSEIEHGRADVVLVIPQDFGKRRDQKEMPQILIAANAVNGTKGSMGSAYLAQILSEELRVKNRLRSVWRQQILHSSLFTPFPSKARLPVAFHSYTTSIRTTSSI